MVFAALFGDGAAERASYPWEVAEMALAHIVSDETEAAYFRSDLFEKRRRLCGRTVAILRHSEEVGERVTLRRKRV